MYLKCVKLSVVDGCRRPKERSFSGAAAVGMDREADCCDGEHHVRSDRREIELRKSKSRGPIATETVTSPALSALGGV